MKHKIFKRITQHIVLAVVIILAAFSHSSAQQKHFSVNTQSNPLKNFAIPFHKESHPFFVDIDGDGDLDCFSGEYGNNRTSKIYFYRNEGSAKSPVFKSITGAENPLDIAVSNSISIPYFVDINGDGTYDCFIADGVTGGLIYYENTGTASQPKFQKQSAAFNPLSMVKFWAAGIANPAFADIDDDGDFDCVIADELGKENYFKNIGNAENPVFMHVQTADDPFKTITSEKGIYNISFQDWDKDGLIDLFINTNYYRNIGTKTNPKFLLTEYNQPVFQNKSAIKYTYTPLRWVDLNNDGIPEVVQGNLDGSFVYQTLSSDSDNAVLSNNPTSINIFPNPTKRDFVLKNIPMNSTSKPVIRVTDLQGKLLIAQNINSSTVKFGEDLKAGAYLVQVILNDKTIYTQKIIKE
jgi:hypothetical protein